MRRLLLPLCAVMLACSGSRDIPPGPGGGGSTDAGLATDGGPAKCRPACTGTQVCVDGQCQLPTCDEGLTRCGALCVDVKTDARNCGVCSKVCTSSGAVCEDGFCGVRCPADDPPLLCQTPNRCVMNHCCGAGESWCADQSRCVSLTTDVNNCGSCGNVCTSTPNGNTTCSGGRCALTCNSGASLCNGTCANYQTDADNCGTCLHPCGVNGYCTGGQCKVTPANCTISASSGWQNCGYALAGDSLTLSATGSWRFYNTQSDANGPDGIPTNPQVTDYRYDIHFNFGALIWRVEGGGVFAFDSTETAGVAGLDGKIQFRINDADGALSSNSGSMDVTVQPFRF